MNFIQTILAFFLALGTLVLVHEMGHYLVARWCGVKVLRFSIGMGKVIYSRRIGPDQTEWALSILPLGGYVKMLDARDQEQEPIAAADLRREFTSQGVWRRIAIVAAGPLANFLLAILLFAGLYMHGMPEPKTKLRAVAEKTAAYQAGLRGGELITAVNGTQVQGWSELRWTLMQAVIDKTPARLDVQRPNPAVSDGLLLDTLKLPVDGLTMQDLESDFLGKLGIAIARPITVLGKIHPDGPAMQAGLREGDKILAVNGNAVPDALAFIELIRASGGKPLSLSGLRASATPPEFTVRVTPMAEQVNGQSIGRIKADVPAAPEMVTLARGPLAALGKAFERTWDNSVLTVKMLGKMVIGEVSWKNVTGPITIADYAGQTARIGIISYLQFIAFISISLGVMNLLPIPVLDGGLLLYYSLEVLTGRPISERFGEIAQRVGLGLLVMLMAVAIFNDIVRLAA